MKSSLRNCVKMKKTVRDSGMSIYSIVGLLELMWDVAHESGPVFKTLDDAELASEWDGDVGAWSSILVANGWLDPHSDGYVVHDYDDHKPYFVVDREYQKEKRKCKKASPTIPDASPTIPDASPTIPDASGLIGDDRTLSLVPLSLVKPSLDLPSSACESKSESESEVGVLTHFGSRESELSVGGPPEEHTDDQPPDRPLRDSVNSILQAMIPTQTNKPKLTHQQVIDRIVSTTGIHTDLVLIDWWRQVLEIIARKGNGHARTFLIDRLDYIDMCQDPDTRKLKDLGQLTKPANFLFTKFTRYLIKHKIRYPRLSR